ncbi:MAG: presqualene diphosphate synthase HpnD [Chloroflexota bacterium]
MSTSATALEAAYRACAAITRREARNFYYAFLSLPAPRRRAIYAAYAFSRQADDIADGPDAPAAKHAALDALRAGLWMALAGDPEGPVLTALADAVTRYAIHPAHLEAVLDGVEMDIEPRRYADFAALREYCYRVASAVGLVSVAIFGNDGSPEVARRAVDLGLAMQLTNIMRDVSEDAAIGRVYLPLDELARFGVSQDDLSAGRLTPPFRELMAFQAARARELFASGALLAPRLHPRSRGCAVGLAHLYTRLLDLMESRGFDVFSQRFSVPNSEKLLLAARLWLCNARPWVRE